MSEDPEDLLSDSLEFLYDYTPITLSSAGTTFIYSPPETLIPSPPRPKLTLKTPETQANNWSLHASSIWKSSVYLADHVEDLRIPTLLAALRAEGEPHAKRPLRILELGAGAGLPSIHIASLYGQDVEVTTSDYPDPDLIRCLEENVQRNGVSRNCVAVPYAWGADATTLLQTHPGLSVVPPGAGHPSLQGFDLVIAADTLWNSESHHIFLQTLSVTLLDAPHAEICLIAGLHTGRYTLQSFLDLLSNYNLEASDPEERSVDDSIRRKWSVDRGEGEDDQQRRRLLLWIRLRWKRGKR